MENRQTLAVVRQALKRLIGEIQQDLFLSSLTIGEAYCLSEVFNWIPHTRWRRQCSLRQHGEKIARRCPHFGERLGRHPPRKPPAANRCCGLNQSRSKERHDEFRRVRLPMTGKGSIHKHGSRGSEVAGNLGAKVSGNAVNRSFNALARGQFLQA